MKRRIWLWLLLVNLLAFPEMAAAKTAPHPLFLVPGWGPPAVVGFRNFVEFLKEDGFPPDQIHVLRYNYLAGLETIKQSLIAQVRNALRAYPRGTRFDVIGHSTGNFVAIYALVAAGLADRIDHYVGLSGIGHGWDCPACALGALGKTERMLAPAYNDFINDFYRENDGVISAISKCSLFSPEDGLIKPYDSGRFADGINIEVRGMRHLDSVKLRENYEIMRRGCFGGSLIP